MQQDRIVSGLAAVLGAITVVMTVLGIAYSPVILFVALTFGVATYFVYYQASGRLAAQVYHSVERRAATGADRRRHRSERGGFGAGPREEWTPPRDGASARADGTGRRTRRAGQQQRGRGRQRARQRVGQATAGPTTAEAYRTLGLDPGADESAVKRAYREKVKEVHPDADSGDEDAFKRVTAAYEQLTD